MAAQCMPVPRPPFYKSVRNNLDASDVPLTRPDMRRVEKIVGDGNCMFRSLSYVLTGSESQHAAVRAQIVMHMKTIAPLMLEHIKSFYVQELFQC